MDVPLNSSEPAGEVNPAGIKGKGRDESRGETRKKSLIPTARKILVQLYTHE